MLLASCYILLWSPLPNLKVSVQPPWRALCRCTAFMTAEELEEVLTVPLSFLLCHATDFTKHTGSGSPSLRRAGNGVKQETVDSLLFALADKYNNAGGEQGEMAELGPQCLLLKDRYLLIFSTGLSLPLWVHPSKSARGWFVNGWSHLPHSSLQTELVLSCWSPASLSSSSSLPKNYWHCLQPSDVSGIFMSFLTSWRNLTMLVLSPDYSSKWDSYSQWVIEYFTTWLQ